MTERGSEHMIITVDTETGKVVNVLDENGKKATPVDPKEVEQIYQSKGFKYVGVILHAESSPGCSYFFFGGNFFRICR
ncbi:MAG: hypothetical protein IMF11_19580 [Proteobacteria bacterium]|nr:hypothetical protein [Pseudomonadota bacterium]